MAYFFIFKIVLWKGKKINFSEVSFITSFINCVFDASSETSSLNPLDFLLWYHLAFLWVCIVCRSVIHFCLCFVKWERLMSDSSFFARRCWGVAYFLCCISFSPFWRSMDYVFVGPFLDLILQPTDIFINPFFQSHCLITIALH